MPGGSRDERIRTAALAIAGMVLTVVGVALVAAGPAARGEETTKAR